MKFISTRYFPIGSIIISLFSIVPVVSAQTSSVEVQDNIDILIKTNRCVECNLSGADLNRLNLSGTDMQGANLSNATFYLADLSNANLKDANLQGVQFGGTDLANADLSGADLRGVEFTGAYLVGAKIDGKIDEVSIADDPAVQDILEKTYIPDNTIPKAAPENKQMNIAERRDFGPVPPQIETTGVTMEPDQNDGPEEGTAPPKKTVSPVNQVSVEQGKLVDEPQNNQSDKEVVLVDQPVIASPQESPASAAEQDENRINENPAPVASSSMTVRESDEEAVPKSDETVMESVVVEEQIDTKETLIQEKTLQDNTKTELTEVPTPEGTTMAASVSGEMEKMLKRLKKNKQCYECNFSGSDLAGKNLDGADMERADFTGANLEKTDFEDTNLKGAIFKNANLRDAKFAGADLYKADFTGADVTGAEFDKALIDETIFNETIGYSNLMINKPE